MFELECCLASSSHEVRWLKVSRLRAHRRPHERGVQCEKPRGTGEHREACGFTNG